MGAVLAVLGSLFMSPSYMATAQLAVHARGDTPSPGGAPATPGAGSDDSTIDTHVTVLLSEAYLRRLLPALRALDGAGQDSARSFLRNIWSKTKELLFLGHRQPSDSKAVAALKGPLKASQERRSRIISVIYTDRDPKRAADVANLVARSYVDELVRQKQAVETQALDAIGIQSAAVQRDLSKVQAELDASRTGQTSPAQRATLEWKMTTLAQQFESLLRRRQELTTKGAGTDPEVTLIAEATPAETPSSLNPFLLVPPITIAFALFACLLAVILHRFDRTLHTEAEAAEALRIPCVGLIPSIPSELSRQPRRLLEKPATAYTKAIRSTVVSLLASDQVASRSQRIVLVTSSVRGEGKSAVSWSFGYHAAQLGQRVLFLDFGQSSRRSGGDTADLFKVLAHDQPLAAAIQPIKELGIDYLSAGLSEGNRLWLLANPKMSVLFEQLRDTYDLVVINAPPLQDVPEVRLLARWADHVLLAVRAGSTNRDLAQSMLQQFARTEDLNANAQFWSVLTRRHPPEPEPWAMDQSLKSTLMMRYRWLKTAAARWMKIEPAIDVSDPAQSNLSSRN